MGRLELVLKCVLLAGFVWLVVWAYADDREDEIEHRKTLAELGKPRAPVPKPTDPEEICTEYLEHLHGSLQGKAAWRAEYAWLMNEQANRIPVYLLCQHRFYHQRNIVDDSEIYSAIQELRDARWRR